ncbi:transposase [Mesorhizobium sp.]|uniref:IS110 family transposase n=1 Tax=Mesorhizobium sp. TaxID=1871066 RepID=UPI00121641B3|nr:MAG: IS110 family transposase [Mesorhizobium sp.]
MKSHKNDDRDAEAIAEAATRPTMRFVPVKSEEQLNVQTLHRARERLSAPHGAHQPIARCAVRSRHRQRRGAQS